MPGLDTLLQIVFTLAITFASLCYTLSRFWSQVWVLAVSAVFAVLYLVIHGTIGV